MKLSRFSQLKTQSKIVHIRSYRHHDRDIDDLKDDGWIVSIILGVVIGIWWGIVHLIDIFFNKLVWWVEPLTIIPVLIVAIPSVMLVEMYGKNPLHWWPLVWGTKVNIPEREPFRAFDSELEKTLDEFGPTRVYMEDYTTLKFRTKKDAVMFSLKNF
jgi:hypothetical protein